MSFLPKSTRQLLSKGEPLSFFFMKFVTTIVGSTDNFIVLVSRVLDFPQLRKYEVFQGCSTSARVSTLHAGLLLRFFGSVSTAVHFFRLSQIIRQFLHDVDVDQCQTQMILCEKFLLSQDTFLLCFKLF